MVISINEEIYINVDEGIDIKPKGKLSENGELIVSKEYNLGTELYNNFLIGQSSLFNFCNFNYKTILIRIARLNKKNKTNFKFKVRTENVNQFRIHRIK